MTLPAHALLIAGVATLALYGVLLGGLALAAGSGAARAVAGFVPDCITLFRRLLADERIPRRRKALVVALLGYLALPFDVVPDFIPVAGQLDDAVAVALVLRAVCRGGTPGMLAEHWPGPRASLALIVRLAHGRAAS
jgi:uncharacterized membrane protein YkvA (DUF1232 family)